MLKITVLFSLLFIVSCAWSSGLSCGSCGPECAPSCGTRRFRACCFNYFRRKRTDDYRAQPLVQNQESQLKSRLHQFAAENMKPQWAEDLTNENQLYYTADTIENHLYD